MTEEQNKESFILIKFQQLGSAEFSVHFSNVTALQVLAASGFLELKAKNTILQEEHERMVQEQQKKLSVPEPKIILPGGA